MEVEPFQYVSTDLIGPEDGPVKYLKYTSVS
jgi:hypothetical protein